MYRIGEPALRIISICFMAAAVSIGLSSSFQATGFGLGTMITAVLRQLVILVPAAYVFSRFLGLNGVWWAFPFAEVFGLIIAVVIFVYVYRTRIKVTPDNK